MNPAAVLGFERQHVASELPCVALGELHALVSGFDVDCNAIVGRGLNNTAQPMDTRGKLDR